MSGQDLRLEESCRKVILGQDLRLYVLKLAGKYIGARFEAGGAQNYRKVYWGKICKSRGRYFSPFPSKS